jgi:hypothetical protein
LAEPAKLFKVIIFSEKHEEKFKSLEKAWTMPMENQEENNQGKKAKKEAR